MLSAAEGWSEAEIRACPDVYRELYVGLAYTHGSHILHNHLGIDSGIFYDILKFVIY
jgi:hypothetical protein